MQRVKVPAGVMTAAAWRAMAHAAEARTPGSPLHLTTRQDIEFHNVREDAIVALQVDIARAGFTGMGACGDTLRNITVCPGCGLDPDVWDLSPLANAIKDAAESRPFIRAMPRKFKISLSGCSAGCARPWTNDIGIVALPSGRFEVMLAGSLGARPATGIRAYEDLEADDILPLTVAALGLFNREGDRTVRTRARLRHVRERMGDGPFLEEIDRLFQREKTSSVTRLPVTVIRRAGGARVLRAVLKAPLGDIAPEAALELADFLDSSGGTSCIGLDHDVLVFAGTGETLPEALDVLAGGPSVVACPGTTWCARGITDSRAVGAVLVAENAPAGLKAAISGCPNNCSCAAVADIGLVGRLKTVNGVKAQCYRLLAGGGGGATAALSRELHGAVPAGRVRDAVRLVRSEYEKSGGSRAAPFADFVCAGIERLSALVAQMLD